MSEVKSNAINIDEIPESCGYMLGDLLHTAITEFYAIPENQAAYEKWLAERQQEGGKT